VEDGPQLGVGKGAVRDLAGRLPAVLAYSPALEKQVLEKGELLARAHQVGGAGGHQGHLLVDRLALVEEAIDVLALGRREALEVLAEAGKPSSHGELVAGADDLGEGVERQELELILYLEVGEGLGDDAAPVATLEDGDGGVEGEAVTRQGRTVASGSW